MNKSQFEEFFNVGLIQTTVNAKSAWPTNIQAPVMSKLEDERAWQEISKAMRSFHHNNPRPRLVVLPELALPRTRMDDFDRLAASLNVIAVVGVDYRVDHKNLVARNEGIVFVPRGFYSGNPSRRCSRLLFGKSYPAPKEEKSLSKLKPPWKFIGDHKVYVFDSHQFGRFGVSICYDFMDIERALMYRGQIQHLFVLAYNQDLGMFRSLADSLSRTVFCNVIVCNTGFHGGSTAVSPYYSAFQRTIYAHDGRSLFTTQVIRLPVRGLVHALLGLTAKHGTEEPQQAFKTPPPGIGMPTRKRTVSPSTVKL